MEVLVAVAKEDSGLVAVGLVAVEEAERVAAAMEGMEVVDLVVEVAAQ